MRDPEDGPNQCNEVGCQAAKLDWCQRCDTHFCDQHTCICTAEAILQEIQKLAKGSIKI